MMLRSLLLVAAIVLVIAPLSAHATGCRDWNRMPESRQWDEIYRMIDDAITGQKGRSYQVNRNAISRCLENDVEDMFLDFNDLCSEGATASKSAIRVRFRQYIWTCVN